MRIAVCAFTRIPRDYPYRLYAIAFVGATGTSGRTVAIGWHFAEENQSPIIVSLVVTSLLAPQIIAGPFGGALADRFGRSLILRLGLLAAAVTTALMLGNVALLPSAAWLLLCLNGVVALISSASFSARRALVADNVKAQQLTRALGTDAVFLSLGFIAGPALAGILAKLVSVEAALLAITAVYAVGAVLVPRRHKTSVGLQPGSFPTTMEPEDGGGPLRVFAWFWRVKPVQTILLLTVAVEFFAFNFVSLAPIVTATTLAGGAGLLGLLRTGFALGESAGNGLALVLGNRLSRFPEFFFGMAVAVQAVAMLLGLSGAVVPVLLLFTVLGLLGAQFEILQSRLLIENTPASTRARILGIQQAAWGAGALGGLISGVIASAFTPRVSLVGMATFGLLIALAIWRCRRATLGRWRDR